MKTALVQMDIAWGDVRKNIERVEELVGGHPGADLYVLPEMFTTGFNGICEKNPAGGLEAMERIAAERGCAVAGSIAVELEGGAKMNRLYFVTPECVWHYDKKHLFTYSGEQRKFTGGEERVVVEWMGFRILLLVCYDLRFPVWSRNRGDYDMILCVASWPDTRRFAWDTLLRARAIENQCFVAAVNRVGTDPSCHYDGGSILLDPYGTPLASCRDSAEELVAGDVNTDFLRECRRRFPVLDDADPFTLDARQSRA
ncbi:MAG: nitrilase-related carbon-nitrogen hydrolase [Candidatus Cryptobacteroides sp.]